MSLSFSLFTGLVREPDQKATHFLCIISGEIGYTKTSAEILILADLCYNEGNEKSPLCKKR